jgi:two-component system, HptB-dependent secretion and biofilm response regulator
MSLAMPSDVGDEQRASRGTALVVDADVLSRRILQLMLERESFRVVLADDGMQAIELFEGMNPDIIFMDVMMPRMDGYQATRILKAKIQPHFVPVIFLTAVASDDTLAACVEAGGDDFLAKPFSLPLLRAKIRAMERMRDLCRTVQTQHRKLDELFEIMQRERQIAEKILDAAVATPNFRAPCIQAFVRPAEAFSGDLLLTVRRPDGGLNILVGDFTGHGLCAAVGASPIAETLRTMVAAGAPEADILASLDAKLRRLLPAGMCMATILVHTSPDMRRIGVWNGGLPDAFLLAAGGSIRERIRSSHPPLGMPLERDDFACTSFDVALGERVFLYSDGLIELRNESAEPFGSKRLEHLLRSSARAEVVATIQRAMHAFRGSRAADDDVTVVQLILDPALLHPAPELVAL